MNLVLSLIVIVVSLEFVTPFDKIRCTERSEFTVCCTKYALVSVTQTRPTDVFHQVFSDDLYQITPYAFKDLSVTKLNLHFIGDHKTKLYPESFFGLPSVRSLTIRWALLDFSANPFQYLRLLTELIIEASLTNNLPPNFLADFPHLRNFSLAGHNLIDITRATFSKVNEDIERVNLNEGSIQFIEPRSFERLGHLKYLSLSRNNLTELQPGVFYGLNDLEELNLQYSRIKNIPGNFSWSLPQLKKLDLSLNELWKIHSGCFSGLKNLNYLDLSDNKLVRLEPGAFFDLRELTFLSLADNEIEVVHYSVFNSLANLRVLNLGRNHITTIAAYAFSGLTLDILSLTRNHNPFSIKSDTFSGLSANEVDIYQFLHDVEIDSMAFRNANLRKLHMNSRLYRQVDRFEWWLSESVQISVSS
uniref:LRRCT domain-containing protein n=1 Tax=Bracon brevicornis TaxID=1563983 RepID=A0A6V7JI39_9HYME